MSEHHARAQRQSPKSAIWGRCDNVFGETMLIYAVLPLKPRPDMRGCKKIAGVDLRTLGTLLFLSALWLLMSGVYTPLVIGLGAGSVLTAVFFIKRMDAQDGDRFDVRISVFQTVKYLIWLMAEIARANWAVTKIILSRKMPIRQHMFSVPHSQKTDLGLVTFANSITLTPGTITVETETDQFLVHAVAYTADHPGALADMDRRVSAIETPGPG